MADHLICSIFAEIAWLSSNLTCVEEDQRIIGKSRLLVEVILASNVLKIISK